MLCNMQVLTISQLINSLINYVTTLNTPTDFFFPADGVRFMTDFKFFCVVCGDVFTFESFHAVFFAVCDATFTASTYVIKHLNILTGSFSLFYQVFVPFKNHMSFNSLMLCKVIVN